MTAPTMETDTELGGMIPEPNLQDPAQLEALFGNYGMWEHYRKVVQANCEELVRAEYAEKAEKITETRISALARTHKNYLDFLADGLTGRIRRERNVFESLRSGA